MRFSDGIVEGRVRMNRKSNRWPCCHCLLALLLLATTAASPSPVSAQGRTNVGAGAGAMPAKASPSLRDPLHKAFLPKPSHRTLRKGQHQCDAGHAAIAADIRGPQRVRELS